MTASNGHPYIQGSKRQNILTEKITTFPTPQKVVLTERQNWGIDNGWSTNRVFHTINSFDSQNHALRWALISPFTEEQMKG